MRLARLASVLGLVYLFLVAIELVGASFKSVGADAATDLIEGFNNPFAGLAAGILATVLVQSSSVTTSTIVGLVGQGALPMSVAVPMIMGANVGTTITNTLVSLGHVTRNDEFKRAFAGATVHDFFNLLTVLLLFPIELATGFLQHSSTYLAGLLPLGEDLTFDSPIKQAVKWCAARLEGGLVAGTGLEGSWLALLLFLLALLMIIVSLYFITRIMKLLMADRIEEMLNRVLGRSGLLGLFIGVVITVSVQSSSITTSLLVPLFAAGLLNIEAGFPIMLGANLGTTITALLAAMVTDVNGLTIALVHLLFNICGTTVFLPFAPMRRIPIWLSRQMAELAITNRVWVIAYVGFVFVAVPGFGVLFFQMLSKK